MRGYPRREFVLRALTACGTFFFVPTRSVLGQDAQGARAAAEYFGGRTDAARTVGTAYLRQLGLEATPASILQAARGATRTIARASSQQKAIAALVRDVQRDFREERSVQVEGWILSRTEVELCLLSLLT